MTQLQYWAFPYGEKMAKSVWQTKYEQLENEFKSFKDKVATTAWEWDGGCSEGKADFLEDIGLPVPSQRWFFQVGGYLNVAGESGANDAAAALQRVVNKAIEDSNLLELADSGRYGSSSFTTDEYYED